MIFWTSNPEIWKIQQLMKHLLQLPKFVDHRPKQLDNKYHRNALGTFILKLLLSFDSTQLPLYVSINRPSNTRHIQDCLKEMKTCRSSAVHLTYFSANLLGAGRRILVVLLYVDPPDVMDCIANTNSISLWISSNLPVSWYSSPNNATWKPTNYMTTFPRRLTMFSRSHLKLT